MSELHVWMKAPACLLLGLCLGPLSCGDGSDDGLGDVCADVAPCGGDPTGTWQGAPVCADDFRSLLEAQGFPAGCESAFRIQAVTLDTTVIISSTDYTENGNILIDWDLALDAACIGALSGQSVEAGDVPALCEAFPQATQGGADSPFDSMTCAMSGDICRCDASQTEAVDSATTITVEGTSLVEASGATSDFCVAGDELTVQVELPMVGITTVRYTRAPE